MKKVLLFILAVTVVFAFWGCQKKEEQPAATQSSGPVGPIVDTGAGGHGKTGAKTVYKVVVPPEVKEQWVSVKFNVEDKKENKKKSYTVNIGDEFKISDSDLTVKTGPFLPDFKMSGQIITSASNNPGNPAVGVAIYEGGKKLFPSSGQWGWLYINFPTVHSFQHERYVLVLEEGIKK